MFQAWVDACTAGLDPALVTSADAADPAALEARGIRELIRPDLAGDAVGRYGSVNTVVDA